MTHNESYFKDILACGTQKTLVGSFDWWRGEDLNITCSVHLAGVLLRTSQNASQGFQVLTQGALAPCFLGTQKTLVGSFDWWRGEDLNITCSVHLAGVLLRTSQNASQGFQVLTQGAL
ncbi:MAG: hypothetical protein KBD24_04080, partial [Candidatus Pacebacteria bacterium]|nr:hypothetical protein [Candidatus Paceibacterota bacterium]